MVLVVLVVPVVVALELLEEFVLVRVLVLLGTLVDEVFVVTVVFWLVELLVRVVVEFVRLVLFVFVVMMFELVVAAKIFTPEMDDRPF